MKRRTNARNSAIAVVMTTMSLMACTGILGVTEVPEADSVDVPDGGDVQSVDVQETPDEADAGDGGAIIYKPKPCETGAKQCYGATRQTCDENGDWKNEGACPYACKDGACTGVCVPDDKQCSGTTPQTCDDNGEWKSETVCASTCQKGACTGVCTPTSKQCSGNGVQTCDGNGAWGTAVACVPSTPACSGASCGSPPSCNGLPNNCGGSAGTDSCCSSIVVPGGTFNRSNDPNYPATLSTFRLDTYELTVGRFRKFVENYSQSMTPSGAGKNPNNPNDPGWDPAWNSNLPADATALKSALKCGVANAWQRWTDSAGLNENRPLNCLSWYEAQAFCIWDGGRLPTEAEWNYAAAGGSQQRVFPWGATIDETLASYYVDGSKECFGDGKAGCLTSDILNVGSIPKGKNIWGHTDMAGNVWEWVQDLYTTPYASATCSDCATLTANAATSRLARGGSFYDVSTALQTDTRGTAQAPTAHNWAIGVRCARSQ